MPELINALYWDSQIFYNTQVAGTFQNQTIINEFHARWLQGLSEYVLVLETAVIVIGIISTVALGLGIYNFIKRRRDRREMEKC